MKRENVPLALRWIVCAAILGSIAQLPPSVRAQEAHFTAERDVTTTGPGPVRLPVDVALLSHGQPFRVTRRSDGLLAEGGLGDLRFFDAQGRAVPYLLLDPPRREPSWDEAAILPLKSTKTTSGFEADLGRSRTVDMLRVEGIPAPFLKRLVLEGSGDRERWTTLVAEGTLFDLPADGLRQSALAFPAGPYRFLRVTWDDTNSGRVPAPHAVAARRAPSWLPAAVTTAGLTIERRPGAPGVSRYRIRLPGANLPIVALDVEIAGGHVYRRATVSESRFTGTEATPAQLGQAMLVRVVRDGVSAAALRIPLTPPGEAEIDLVVEDGANPPADVRRVSAVFAELPWIYLEAPGGPIVARYGSATLQNPTYDLEALRPSIDLAALRVATWGEARSLVESGAVPSPVPAPEPGAVVDAGSFRHVRSIPASRRGLVAVSIDAAALAHSRGPAARFADLRVLDPLDRQIPYLLERRDDPLAVDLVPTAMQATQSPALATQDGRRQSIYALHLPHPGLPAGTLVVETTARVFRRNVRVGVERPADRRHRTPWFDVRAEGTWQHVDQQVPAAPLALSLGELEQADLLLLVDEGDNAALPLGAVRLLLPHYRLRLYQPDGAALRLAYGRADLERPRYDLTLLAPQVMGAAALEVAPEPETGEPASPTVPALLSPAVFWMLLTTTVVVLIAIIARLVRSA
jgi:hypothetical protein